ncbi:MAG: BlaI/MecI/CopY family transcriptional regulator [Cyclobacteriaceae bacterium]|nr:BlaI/MecI/CopY family transcriptional regulator [Cyclobacteriaceae bacterium]
MRELTKAEDQIMQILWQLKTAFVKDVIAKLPSPKPAYNTVSTIIRILEKKGFVSFKAYGKTHEYFPIIEKDEYSNYYLKSFVNRYFKGSFQDLVSFFAKENKMNITEMEEMIKRVESDLEKGD